MTEAVNRPTADTLTATTTPATEAVPGELAEGILTFGATFGLLDHHKVNIFLSQKARECRDLAEACESTFAKEIAHATWISQGIERKAHAFVEAFIRAAQNSKDPRRESFLHQLRLAERRFGWQYLTFAIGLVGFHFYREFTKPTIYDLLEPPTREKREPGSHFRFLVGVGSANELLVGPEESLELSFKALDRPSMRELIDSPTALGLAATLLQCNPHVSCATFVEAFMDAVENASPGNQSFQALREDARTAEKDRHMPTGLATGLAAIHFYAQARRSKAAPSA